MKLELISGLSGSGKSTALRTLEDLGYYCIDNLPVPLLYDFAQQMRRRPIDSLRNSAVGIDARNLEEDLRELPGILDRLQDDGIDCEVIFLTADDNALFKRFSETRRRHPLSGSRHSLADAIEDERARLEPIAARAHLIIDTSLTNIHELRDLIRNRIFGRARHTLSLLFESFGYKHGVPGDADFVFDVRCLPNPYWDRQLQPLTGLDDAVVTYLESQPLVTEMTNDIRGLLERWLPQFQAENRSYITVAVGCTGGQHRSVYVVEKLAAHFKDVLKGTVLARHRGLK